MTRRRRTRRLMLVPYCATAALLALAACSDGAAPSGSTAFTTAQTTDIGNAGADEAQQAMDAFDVSAAANPQASVAAPSYGSSVAAYSPPGTSCATVSATADADGDGARDSTVYTFALPACQITGYRGGVLSLTGLVTITDPTPAAADFAYKAELKDFTFALQGPAHGPSFTSVRNGSRQLTATAGGLTLTNQVTTVRSVTGRPDATLTHNLLLQFTPAQGSTLAYGSPLPSGTFTKTGTLSWSRGAEQFTFNVTTPTPLVYDASCSGPHYERITAGEVHLTLASGAYVKIVWSGCDVEPVHTFVPAPPT